MSGLSATQILLLLLFSLSLAAGQLLFKLGASQGAASLNISGAFELLTRPLIFSALVLYGLSTLLWTYLLTKIPLTTAYPFAALAFVFVPLGARYFLGESLSLRYLLGMSMILLGVGLTSSASSEQGAVEPVAEEKRGAP